MFAGLKEFGLKGMKENKGRVAAGATIVATTGVIGTAMMKKGINRITGKHK